VRCVLCVFVRGVGVRGCVMCVGVLCGGWVWVCCVVCVGVCGRGLCCVCEGVVPVSTCSSAHITALCAKFYIS
jgi:hypothetical protein